MEVGAMGEEGVEEEQEPAEEGAMYVAVGREAKEWKANLQWVLGGVPRSRRLVLAHVHRPAERVNMMGAWVPVNQLEEQEVAAYRQLEKEKVTKVLDDLLAICKSQKVNASKIVVESDDIASGIVRLVGDHGVTELVMGAASDRQYSRKMRSPRSKKALTVLQRADPYCKIWFVCKGHLICTREVGLGQGQNTSDSSTTSTSPRSSNSDYSRSKSLPRPHSETPSLLDQIPSGEDSAMDRSVGALNAEADATVESSTLPAMAKAEEEFAGVESVRKAEEGCQPSSSGGSDAAEIDEELYDKLRDALIEAENLKSEAYEETRRRQNAERDLADVSHRARDAESSYLKEAKHRKGIEQRLAREQASMEQDRQELHSILDQIQKANDRSTELELQITKSERTMSDIERQLSESCRLLDTLRREHRREDPARESALAMRCPDGDHRVTFLRYSYSELKEATNDFDESVRIGEAGRHGSIYEGRLRNMTVAIEMVNADVAVDELEFTLQVEAISRVSHPHLVAFVGACSEARAVVHELLPGGSLEDRLESGGGAPPLTWHMRACIAYRTCSALAFLHSTKPRPTVHGDVRPETILLDEHLSSKLAGLGMSRLVDRSCNTATARHTALAYVDPHYLATGELTPHCDVYSLGVVLLRLVTGKPASLAKKAVQDAASGGGWHEAVDASAGGWPLEHAKEVALLGLKCCDVKRRHSPAELIEEVRMALEAAVSAAPGRASSSRSVGSDGEGTGSIPSYFLCPIFKEIMKDPQIAADGFTYEAEAIREWLERGHGTSPMTNLKLPSAELIPNHALRSAIREWLHKRQHLLFGFID